MSSAFCLTLVSTFQQRWRIAVIGPLSAPSRSVLAGPCTRYCRRVAPHTQRRCDSARRIRGKRRKILVAGRSSGRRARPKCWWRPSPAIGKTNAPSSRVQACGPLKRFSISSAIGAKQEIPVSLENRFAHQMVRAVRGCASAGARASRDRARSLAKRSNSVFLQASSKGVGNQPNSTAAQCACGRGRRS